jgi:hypothetical protein
MPQEDDASIKAEIAAAPARGRDDDWNAALWHAVDVLAEETTFASWTGGDIVGTITVDGEERPVRQMPYPEYAR